MTESLTHPILQRDFELETDRLTGTRIRDGNMVMLLASGTASFRLRWQLLERAQKSIYIVAFSLFRDETGYHLRDLLLEKLRQGLEVRLIFDDAVLFTTFGGDLLKSLSQAGAGVVKYHKLFEGWLPKWKAGRPFRQITRTARLKLKRRFHEKYLIVDGREAILGGANWGNKYAYGGTQPKAWRDSDAYLCGPVVADVQHQFIKDFLRYAKMEKSNGLDQLHFAADVLDNEAPDGQAQFHFDPKQIYAKPFSPTENARIRYIPHKPYDDNKLWLTEAYLQMFRKAREYIYWGCHSIRPPRILAETLMEAVNRGVEVRLITNSRHSSRTLMAYGLLGWIYWESSNHFRWLLEKGVKIYEWQKPGAFHSKNMVIDDIVASVGSYNVTSGSTFHHTESNIVVYGGQFPGKVREQFEIDLKDCRELKLEDAKVVSPRFDPFRRPLLQRNLLIDRSLLTEPIKRDLDEGHYKPE